MITIIILKITQQFLYMNFQNKICDVIEPVRKIITNVYLCTICNLKKSKNKSLLGVVYNMKEYNDFILNET